MKCDFRETEDFRDGKRIIRCSRCKNDGVKPPPGTDGVLHADCDGIPRLPELGGWIGVLLESYLLANPPRWVWLKWRLGFGPTCNCQEREAAANAFGEQFFHGLAGSYCAAGGLAIR